MKTYLTEQSSRIRSLSWDDGIMRVEFTRGGIYEYMGVPEQVYDDLTMSSSLGKAFDEAVKGKYPFTKLS